MLWTVGIYVLVQMVESNLLTPVIQRHQVSLPMALILFAQLVLGVYTGVLGLVLATPIFAIIMVLIKTLYVEDVLDDHEKMLAPEKKVMEEMS
jgi:predicted PurR-regulated permease PerM